MAFIRADSPPPRATIALGAALATLAIGHLCSLCAHCRETPDPWTERACESTMSSCSSVHCILYFKAWVHAVRAAMTRRRLCCEAPRALKRLTLLVGTRILGQCKTRCQRC